MNGELKAGTGDLLIQERCDTYTSMSLGGSGRDETLTIDDNELGRIRAEKAGSLKFQSAQGSLAVFSIVQVDDLPFAPDTPITLQSGLNITFDGTSSIP